MLAEGNSHEKPIDRLTPREREVLGQIAPGARTRRSRATSSRAGDREASSVVSKRGLSQILGRPPGGSSGVLQYVEQQA